MRDTILLILYVVILIDNQMAQMSNTIDMLQYKSRLSRYGDLHLKERTVLRSSYLHNSNHI